MDQEVQMNPLKKKLKIWIHKHQKIYYLYKFPKFRYLTSPCRCLPDFIIIGAQKSGTTSLYDLISKHPGVMPPRHKELHYFSTSKYGWGTRWYRLNFPTKLEKRILKKKLHHQVITGEATPNYILHPNTKKRIKNLIPKAKIIVILRNPVDRAYSHYNHNVRRKLENLSFEEAIQEKRFEGEEDKIYEPVTILKSKPLLEHNGQYLIPSFPLLIWAVEEVVEAAIKKNQQLSKKYPNIKHDFLLNQGLEFFKTLLPTASLIKSNLFYYVNNDRCETDGLIIYDKILFIIEAKGHRITKKAKGGHELKTQDHLKDIVRDSYTQGIRTLKYIEENVIAEFKTTDRAKVEINRNDFDDIIIVSMTLEPIGNLSMSIKATNELGYFNEGHFPWIISIYDLIVLADLFENPIMLIHYIKRRKKFLSSKLLSTYEELDLVSYFLFNGLYIEHTLKEAKEKNVSRIEFSPSTDAINDYYMYKFGSKTKFTDKPKCYISKEFNNFLLQLDRSKVSHRVRMALLLIEFNDKSIKQLMDLIKKTKKEFSKDKGLHDCSIYTHSLGGLGVTFMTGQNKNELSFKLHQYCTYKLHQQNSNTWIGFGDTSTDRKVFNFQSMYFAMSEKIE